MRSVFPVPVATRSETVFSQLHSVVQRLHRFLLVRPHFPGLALTEIILRNFNRRERPAGFAHLHQSLKVSAGKERVDNSGVVVAVVPEIDKFAICQEDERRADLLGVGQGLLFRRVGLNCPCA